MSIEENGHSNVGGEQWKHMFTDAPVAVDLGQQLGHRDHSKPGKWHSLGPPSHLAIDHLERHLVAPHAKSITEELTGFMEEYFWRVDTGTQKELFESMFTEHGMYYNNGIKRILHGAPDAALTDHGVRWLMHQIDRMTIMPTLDGEGPVLVHVLGSHWNGDLITQDKEEQMKLPQRRMMRFSETFELVKEERFWKINRVILMMHDDIMEFMKAKGIDSMLNRT